MVKKTTLRQREIVEAARAIIFEVGVEGLTVRKIADELKITDGALYRHFKSKEEILSLLIDDIEATLLATVSLSAQQVDDPLKKLESIFLAHLHYAEKRKGVTFTVMASLKEKKLQKKMFSVINKYFKLIKNILRQGIAEKKFRSDINLESAIIAFWGMVQGIVTIWGVSRYKYTIKKDRVQGMFDAYRRGIERK